MLQKHELFSVFNLKPSFQIDKNALKRAYYEACKVHHPDVSKSDTNFVKVNKAYRILENDLRRAEYMCSAEPPKLDANFFAEVMDYEDKIAMIRDVPSLESARSEIARRIQECYQNYLKPEFVAKWRYFERLLTLLEKKRYKIKGK